VPTIVHIMNTSNPEPKGASAYYLYAAALDEEVQGINRSWQTDKAYYWLADVDHDGLQELVVRMGAGIAVYKEQEGGINQIFYDRLEERADGGTYNVTNREGLDYIVYTTKDSLQGTLFVIQEGRLQKACEGVDILFAEPTPLEGLR